LIYQTLVEVVPLRVKRYAIALKGVKIVVTVGLCRNKVSVVAEVQEDVLDVRWISLEGMKI
jgi:hypothetical protein